MPFATRPSLLAARPPAPFAAAALALAAAAPPVQAQIIRLDGPVAIVNERVITEREVAKAARATDHQAPIRSSGWGSTKRTAASPRRSTSSCAQRFTGPSPTNTTATSVRLRSKAAASMIVGKSWAWPCVPAKRNTAFRPS